MSKELGYVEGYLQGLIDSGWDCIDCGNKYEAKVDECPNHGIDEATAKLRYTKRKAEDE